jgi:thiosulfate/3-mercaptopyruvate sulfurtransferase
MSILLIGAHSLCSPQERRTMSIEKLPSILVETEWLASHLDEPDLRILDSTMFLRQSAEGFSIESGYDAWAEGHIPSAGFADLLAAFSDTTSQLRFTVPSAEQFAANIEALGVSNDTFVIIYDRGQNVWATRLWWLLRTFGFDNAAVLNGGWHKWTLEERPVSAEAPTFERGHFVPHFRPELIATKDEVFAAISDERTCLINALSEAQHDGQVEVGNGRHGHIPSSVNVPAGGLLDANTNAYLPLEQLREKVASVGATTSDRAITYCGGGIAASSDAFVLTLLGVPGVALYDGSLSEWTADPNLPLETGSHPATS